MIRRRDGSEDTAFITDLHYVSARLLCLIWRCRDCNGRHGSCLTSRTLHDLHGSITLSTVTPEAWVWW
jgi:hypothetical protein